MPTSLALHLALAILLLVRLPEQSPPAKEQSIDVELVSPPKAEEQVKQEPDEAKAERSRPQPQAFESASARADKEKPEAQLPPAAPKASENSRPKREQSPPASAETQSAASDKPTEARTALAALRVDSEDAANGAANAPPPQSPPVPVEKPVPDVTKADDARKSEEASSERQGPALQEAQELYSKNALSDPRVKQALGRLPPKKRIVQLCSIEALEQVRRQRPDAFPDMLVPFGPSGGFISAAGMSANGGAFRSRAKWYAVDFKCDVDAETSSVVSFSFAIGKAIPQNEWGARQLPIE